LTVAAKVAQNNNDSGSDDATELGPKPQNLIQPQLAAQPS